MPGISARNSNVVSIETARKARQPGAAVTRLTPTQRDWLTRGLRQPGGKLPLFDGNGQRVNERTIKSCIRQGWAEPWFNNPLKPDWQVCKLTDAGRRVLTTG